MMRYVFRRAVLTSTLVVFFFLFRLWCVGYDVRFGQGSLRERLVKRLGRVNIPALVVFFCRGESPGFV